jgi:hypothetical protein
MEGFQPDPQTDRPAQGVEFAAVVTDLASRRITRKSPSDPPLRCVSSGYMADGCSCRATIPAGTVTDAWAREKRSGAHGDRFFHFTWRGEVWAAYGLKNGLVRGVYCPEHTAERERRTLAEDSGREGTPAKVALTG